ncbi:hypothetical protein OPT61_g8732 [Boeremia exigua]|uniref:Uncharacterized protein n=1 Tax=Boeremia exigua TaxID=749465 RepID=A0ACC2HX12_9PLEO|nr:hypothetical protein OPT61_g8732 [Boeremia exigua]
MSLPIRDGDRLLCLYTVLRLPLPWRFSTNLHCPSVSTSAASSPPVFYHSYLPTRAVLDPTRLQTHVLTADVDAESESVSSGLMRDIEVDSWHQGLESLPRLHLSPSSSPRSLEKIFFSSSYAQSQRRNRKPAQRFVLVPRSYSPSSSVRAATFTSSLAVRLSSIIVLTATTQTHLQPPDLSSYQQALRSNSITSSKRSRKTSVYRNSTMAGAMADIGGKVISGMTSLDIKVDVSSSPPSGNSSDTLHDNESSGDEGKNSDTSRLSAATLNMNDLKIYDDSFPSSPHHINRSADAFYGNGKQHHTPAPTYNHQAQNFRRHGHHLNQGHGFARGGGIHRNARTWVSEESRAAQEFLTVRNSMRRMFKNADVAKWKAADFIAHRNAMAASAANTLAQQKQSKQDEANLQVPPISPQKQEVLRRRGLVGNFEQVGNFGRALGERTIWCKDWQNGKDEVAPWPCLAEMKWEGDDRAKTGVGRYPPLPREQGPVGLPWNQLQAVEQYPMDRIACIPTMEDVYLPVDEIDDEVKYDLLNKDLEDAMDAYLES